MPRADKSTHFGFREVPLTDKQALVDDVFHSVARRYDLMNDLMSGGLHRAWKDALVTTINPPPKGRSGRPFALLDVAGGTGDIAFRVIEAGGAGTHATVVDINAAMLEVGRARAADLGLDAAVTFVDGNAEMLPFPDTSYDAVTIAFGIRNVPADASSASNFPPSTCRASTRSTISTPSTSSPRSAAPSPRTPRPIAISSNRSAVFRGRRRSPR